MVSIIVPAYNQAHFLSYALDSVLTQTMGDWECLIINDGSTDGTGQLAEDYARKDARFKVIHQTNHGLAGARNAGIHAALGEYLVFLDSDDGLHQNMLEVLVPILAASPSLPGVVCRATSINHAGARSLSPRKQLSQQRWSNVMWALFYQAPTEVYSLGNLFSPVCGCWRSAVIKGEGGFEKTPTGLEDYDLWLRVLARHGPWAYRSEHLVDYRRAPGSMSGNAALMSHGWKVALDRFFQQLSNGLIESGRLRAWHMLGDVVREQVFPVPGVEPVAAKPGLDLSEPLQSAAFDPSVARTVSLALLCHLVLSGDASIPLNPLRPSRQDHALALVTASVRLWKQKRRRAVPTLLARALASAPLFVLGPVTWSLLTGAYYPLTNTFRHLHSSCELGYVPNSVA